ncbi:hypothetical protein BFN03_02270 [Rhodococcus sp. WMMA185]|uniref:hypothetical protein n=1 Tax=Rhodococcus sp. WMMA185 TaxID=679318 RepID=UPI000878D780|nr:hypothetical protein [Rhodococcus sp. WMMA185]AOW91916.1 hypothetical protein BFN03_02270 [Rhodococcus sp. WMMA185]
MAPVRVGRRLEVVQHGHLHTTTGEVVVAPGVGVVAAAAVVAVAVVAPAAEGGLVPVEETDADAEVRRHVVGRGGGAAVRPLPLPFAGEPATFPRPRFAPGLPEPFAQVVASTCVCVQRGVV